MQNKELVVFFLSLGSNLGQREKYLQVALDMLQADLGIKLVHCSSIYETDPVGYMDQDLFLNLVVKGYTVHSANKLLQITQGIEACLGRTRELHWGPRTLDIDILMYNDKHIAEQELIIPHPRMKERAFVLIPLAEIAGEWLIPGESQSVRELAARTGKEGVRIWKGPFLFGADESELLES